LPHALPPLVSNLPSPPLPIFHYLFFFYCYSDHRDLHSFPTRRSSDLPLSVRKSMVLDSRGLDVTGALTLPGGANWANTNVVELYSFTNRGIINIPQSDFAGTDRVNPYDNYVNRGTNNAASHQIRTRNFEDSGC